MDNKVLCVHALNNQLHIPPAGSLSLFENHLVFHLSKKGRKLVGINQEEIDKAIAVEFTRAIVKDRRLDGRPKAFVKMSMPYPNNTGEFIDEKWSYSVAEESGTEKAVTKGQARSVNFSLAPCVEVAGVAVSLGSIGANFDKYKENTTVVSQGSSVTENVERTVRVPPYKTVVAKHLKETKKFKCEVIQIGVSFNPKKKVKCQVQKADDEKKITDEHFELREFFHIDDDPIPDKDEKIHRTCSGKYEWIETTEDFRIVEEKPK